MADNESNKDLRSLKIETRPWRIPSPGGLDDHDEEGNSRIPLHPLYYSRPWRVAPPSNGQTGDGYWDRPLHPLYYPRPSSSSLMIVDPDASDDPPQALLESQLLEAPQEPSDAVSQDGDLSMSIYSQSSLQGSDIEMASPDVSSRERASSISFDRAVRVDDGQQKSIEEPSIKVLRRRGTKSRSILDEFSTSTAQQNGGRTSSESARSNNSMEQSFTTSRRSSRRERPSSRQGSARYPLLQSTVDEIALEPESLDAAILSASSASSQAFAADHAFELSRSVGDEYNHRNPSSPIEFTGIARSASFGLSRPTSARSLGYYLDRNGSARRPRRQDSLRSDSFTSASPAGTYLARWKTETVPEPDEEGQEIGDHSGYIIGRQIGYGGFSVVKEVFSLQKGERLRQAVKIVRKQITGKDDQQNDRVQAEFEHEVSIWRYLKHPCILSLIEVYDTPFATFCITPLNVGGTLYDLVRSQRRGASSANSNKTTKIQSSTNTTSRAIAYPLSRRYLYQIAVALRYLHQDVRIVHRDIKLENCLLNTSGPGEAKILLCDFGMADFIDRDDRDGSHEEDPFKNTDLHNIGPSANSTSVAGSLQYASPELIEATAPLYEPYVDIWGLGVLCYALLTGDLPFSHGFAPKLQKMILDGQWDTAPLRAIGVDAVEMVSSCLTMDPMARWTVADVLQCGFLNGQQKLYEKEFGGTDGGEAD